MQTEELFMNNNDTWTPMARRHPNSDDWDDTHGVEVANIQTSYRELFYAAGKALSIHCTHWRRVELPPLPAREQTQEEKDVKLIQKGFGHLKSNEFGLVSEGFLYALANERAALGGVSAEQFVKELREMLFSHNAAWFSEHITGTIRIPREDWIRLRALIPRAAK
jgi:hypothetical protein